MQRCNNSVAVMIDVMLYLAMYFVNIKISKKTTYQVIALEAANKSKYLPLEFLTYCNYVL